MLCNNSKYRNRVIFIIPSAENACYVHIVLVFTIFFMVYLSRDLLNKDEICATCAERMAETRNTYIVVVGNLYGKDNLRDSRNYWKLL
jgi:hypothetical protein